jgi:hypothetical protein
MTTYSAGPTHRAFVEGSLDLEAFDHRGHLEVAYGCLRVAPFFRASAEFTERLQGYLDAAGLRDKYHATITLAFLALVHERLAVRGDPGSFPAFLDANPDLLDATVVRRRWGATLDHPLARSVPLLPGAEPWSEPDESQAGRLTEIVR